MDNYKPKGRNDIGRWIVLALICAGGSTGGTMLRPHNPEITTKDWIKMQLDVEALQEGFAELRQEVRVAIRRLPQRQP